MASATTKSKRARKLLKRLLSVQQWEEFNSYNSFREKAAHNGRTWLIEIGVNLHGWIQFNDLEGKQPSFVRSAGIVSSSRGWCIEDLMISLLLKARTHTATLNPSWACQGGVPEGDKKLIVQRQFHLPVSQRKVS